MVFIALDSPRTIEPGEIYTGCWVYIESAVFMYLEKGGWYFDSGIAFDGFKNNISFAFSESHDDYLIGW